MRTRLLVLVTAFLLVQSVPARAQDDSTPTRQDRLLDVVTRILELTDLQAQQLADLAQSHRETVEPLTAQIQDLEKQKAELLSEQNPTPEQITILGSLLFQQQALRRQIQDANRSHHESAMAVLTAEQQRKVSQVQMAVRLIRQARPLAAFGLVHIPPSPRPR